MSALPDVPAMLGGFPVFATERTTSHNPGDNDPDYDWLEAWLRTRIGSLEGPLFETDVTGHFSLWLSGLPEAIQQHYNCNSCRRFFERYAGLVHINEFGVPRSALLGRDPVVGLFSWSVMAVQDAVEALRVTGVFVSDEKVWGTPQSPCAAGNRPWTHLSGTPQSSLVWSSRIQTASQRAAQLREEYGLLQRSLQEYPAEVARQALRVLDLGGLYRSEKAQAIADWFYALHESLADMRGRQRDNLVWLAVAKAPAGFVHLKNGILGTLMDDVLLRLDFEAIKARWAAKLHPLQYQRPTAPPTDGQITQAEKLVTQLGLTSALPRRFARLDEVQHPLWLPASIPPLADEAAPGVFSHLRQQPRGVPAIEIQAPPMSWDEFAERVLPNAAAIEVYLAGGRESFFGLVSSVDLAAPPILQWDGLDGLPRNPVSWYFYHGGSLSSAWGLPHSSWVTVTAIFKSPAHWQSPERFRHHAAMVLLALQGAQDQRHHCLGSFFPEMLKGTLHGVRSVLEAHARSTPVAGPKLGTANGIRLGSQGCLLRVRDRRGDVVKYQVHARE